MSNVDIKVFNIARTQVDHKASRQWLDHLGAGASYVLQGIPQTKIQPQSLNDFGV